MRVNTKQAEAILLTITLVVILVIFIKFYY